MAEWGHIRASMLSYWRDCPRRAAAAQWGDRIPDVSPARTGPEALVGTAAHAGAQIMAEAKRDGVALPDPEVVRAVIDSVISEQAGGVDAWSNNVRGVGAATSMAVRASEAVRDLIATDLTPTSVEAELQAELPGGYVLTGHLDLYDARSGALADWKFGYSVPWAGQQLGAYALLLGAQGERPRSAEMICVPRRAKADATVIRKSIPIAPAVDIARRTIREVIDQTDRYLDTQDPGSFPENPASMMCSAKYCRAYGTAFCGVGGR